MLDHRSLNKAYFFQLPEEIIQRVLFYCDPDDLSVNVQRVCQRLHRLANEPLLWWHHCCVNFHYWDARHCMQRKLIGPTNLVDWKSIYSYRRLVDLKTTRLLNSIIQTQVNRISKFEAIAKFGYDAKDTLLRHIQVEDNVHDVLARRYYANSALDYIHRIMALEEWQKILDNKDVPIENALGCFDLFILHSRSGDFSEISEMLNEITECFRLQYPGIENLSSKAKAFTLIEFMRIHNFTGLVSNWAYQRLQNYYIGLYLQDPKYPPLPLTCIAIFCAISRRIGLDARCCGVIDYQVIVVFLQEKTVDAKTLNDRELNGQLMYLDPHRFLQQVSPQTLRKNLSKLGVHPSLLMEYLSDMGTASVVRRMSKTIMACVNTLRAHNENRHANDDSLTRQSTFSSVELEKAYYSVLWADFLFSERSNQQALGIHQSRILAIVLERYERLYSMDACLIEKYILPLYDNPPNSRSSQTYNQIVKTLRELRNADQTPKMVRSRCPLVDQKVRYKIGQVFRHKRYYYTAVIIGWDLEGENFGSIYSNDASSLSLGLYQSFYNVLVEDTSIRYVAEENIEICNPEFPSTLMSLAGRYFNRWDSESHTFISGIRDEYPED